MKKFLTMGALALAVAAINSQPAPAWLNWKFGVGLNFGWQSGGNNTLWGLFRNGQPPAPDCGFGGPGGPGGCALPGGPGGPGYGVGPYGPASIENPGAVRAINPADSAAAVRGTTQSYTYGQQQYLWNQTPTNTVGYRYYNPYYNNPSYYGYGYYRR